MKNIILFVVVLIVSGCVAQSKKLCAEYGFAKGTREFSNCVMNEHHRAVESFGKSKPSLTCRTKPDYLTLEGSVTVCD